MRALLAAAVFSLLPQLGLAQTRLEYRWPGGIEATVEMQKLRTRGEAGTDTIRSAMSYRMRTRPHEGGLLISYDSFRVPQLAGQMPDEMTQEMFGALLPGFTVTRQGAFGRIVGIEAMKAIIDSVLSESGQATTPQAQALVAQLTSEEALSANAAAEWDAMVGTWIGADMNLNEVLELEVEEPVAIMPDVTLPMLYEFELLDYVPCNEWETIKRCVVLERRSSPDPASFKQLVANLMKAGGADTGSYLESMELENRVLVVTDPKRLLPYRVTVSKAVSGTGRDRGELKSFSSLEVKRYSFTYQHEARK